MKAAPRRFRQVADEGGADVLGASSIVDVGLPALPPGIGVAVRKRGRPAGKKDTKPRARRENSRKRNIQGQDSEVEMGEDSIADAMEDQPCTALLVEVSRCSAA